MVHAEAANDFDAIETLATAEDEEIFRIRWVRSELHDIVESGMRSYTWFLPFFYFYLFMHLPGGMFVSFLGISFGFVTTILLSLYGVQKKILVSYWGCLLVEFSYGLLVVYIFHELSRLTPNLSEHLNMMYVFLGFTVYGIAMFPMPPMVGILSAGLGMSLAGIGVFLNPLLPYIQTTMVLWLGIGFAVAIRVSRYKNLQREAQLICEKLKIHRDTESLKRANIETELLHAQKIQDSFLPPPQSLVHGSIKAQFFQEKHGVLGGDWMSARFLPQGHLIGLVADVTGKGVSAALVVHAVQSLWVQASYQEDFEPVAWIKKLNKVLLTMGSRSPHSLTLGFITVMAGYLIYYSAGHVPLFLTQRSTGKVRALGGGGTLLGIGESVHVKHVFFEWDPNDELSIFLGSDGVFPRGSRTSAREINSLDASLKGPPSSSPLENIASNDDKMLLHILWNSKQRDA